MKQARVNQSRLLNKTGVILTLKIEFSLKKFYSALIGLKIKLILTLLVSKTSFITIIKLKKGVILTITVSNNSSITMT